MLVAFSLFIIGQFMPIFKTTLADYKTFFAVYPKKKGAIRRFLKNLFRDL